MRQLLSHLSGVSDYYNDNPATWNTVIGNFSAYWSPEKILSYVLAPRFNPGTFGRHSNTGYILAGMIIKEATGDTTFTEVLHNEILDPLDLTHTMVDVEEPLVADLAHGWTDWDGDHIREDIFDNPRTSVFSSAWTAGGMMATAEDLCNFTWHIYRGDILNPVSMQEMFTFKPVIIGNISYDYGLGTDRAELLGETLLGHSGNLDWYTAFTIYSPKYDISISALVNQDPFDFTPPDFGPRYATIEILRVILDYFKFPYDKVHPFHLQTDKTFLKTNSDSLTLTTEVNNPDGNNIQVYAILKDANNSKIDSAMMYDDGSHSDSLAGDNKYGCYFPPFSNEDRFSAIVRTMDIDSSFNHVLPEGKSVRFTTIGPVQPVGQAYIDTSYNAASNTQLILLLIKNYGNSAKAENLSVTLSTNDNRIERMVFGTRNIPDLDPGQTDTSTVVNTFAFQYVDGYLPDSTRDHPITFDVTVSSSDFPYWKSSFDFTASKIATSVEILPDQFPKQFVLIQNFPNPFNPKTTIRFSLPQSDFITLKIYNILGEEVSTLVSNRLAAGEYTYEWDAGNLASGVYLCRLTTGGQIRIRKMILMK